MKIRERSEPSYKKDLTALSLFKKRPSCAAGAPSPSKIRGTGGGGGGAILKIAVEGKGQGLFEDGVIFEGGNSPAEGGIGLFIDELGGILTH